MFAEFGSSILMKANLINNSIFMHTFLQEYYVQRNILINN